MGRRYPTLLAPARCAGGGMCGWGSLPPGACGTAPSGTGAPAPVLGAGCTSAASFRGESGEGNWGAEAGASPIMLPAPPPRPSPVQRIGGGGGEPGGTRDAITARDIAAKTSLIGQASPASAAEGGAATEGASAGRGGVGAV